MLRITIVSLILLLALLPVGVIEKTGASQSDQSDVKEFLQAGSFVPPVHGPIRYSSVPVDGGSAFDVNNPQTWYTMAWAGRYSGPAAQRGEGSGGHAGVDIRDRYGEMTGDLGVYAIAVGVVIRRRNAGGWGNFVAIRHDNVVGLGTIYSVYAHLAAFDPSIANGQEGQVQVTRGQRIATMGSAGLSSSAARHLHFQIDKTWPESKNEPYWPGTYPVSEADASLTQEQRQQAAASVMANTISPMMLVETGSIGSQTGNARVSISQDCGPPGTAFVLQWSGFTPNNTLTSHLRKPDSMEFLLQFNTDSQGNARHTIDSSMFMRGTHQHWAVDDTTGRRSNILSFDITTIPEGSAAITFGQSVSFFHASSNPRPSFAFCGRAGDVISIRSVGTWPVGLSLMDERNAVLASGISPSGQPVRFDGFLPTSGNFKIICFNAACCSTETYGFNLQRVSNPNFTVPIACGGRGAGVISTVGDRDTFIFNGTAADRVTITMSRGSSGDIQPLLEVYDPDGNLITDATTTGTTATISNLILGRSGRFTILASDTSVNSGSCTLSLQCQRWKETQVWDNTEEEA